MQELSQILVGTLTLGAVYAVVGIGFVILFRSTGALNFAQGGFMALGAYTFFWLYQTLHLPWMIAFVLAAVLLGVLGAGIYLVFMKRLVGAPSFSLVIASIGLSVVILTAIILLWSSRPKVMPEVVGFQPVKIGFIRFTRTDIVVLVAAVAIIVVLELALRRSRLGVRMRAVADSPLLSAYHGINVYGVSALAWGIAAFCASIAGAVYSIRTSLDYTSISAVGLLAFPAILLGGMDSIRGAMAGGVILAFVQTLTSSRIEARWSPLAAYAVLLIVLLIRPRGLLGSRRIARL